MSELELWSALISTRLCKARMLCGAVSKRTLLLCMQALTMLNKELEIVKSLSSTLSSFKEDPSMMAGRGKPVGGRGDREDVTSGHGRDPDVWPPPTPQEPR